MFSLELTYTSKSYGEHSLYIEASTLIKNKNYKKSLETLSLCKSYSKCQLLLGYIYNNGFSIKKNNQKAIYFFKLALEAGEEEANFNLATVYIEEKKYKKALLLLNSIEYKDGKTYYNLGLMYLYGYGVIKNSTKAHKFLKKSSELGYIPSSAVLNYVEKNLF
jgi:uncharacterized protein